jgi:hypothetical protein
VELLWHGVVVAFILGSVAYVGLGNRTPHCHDCRMFALIQSRQIADSSPPIFEVIYCCPSCREILWKRFVSTISH